MDKTQFLNYTNKKLKNQVNISKNWALRKVLEKPLEIISKVLIVPPIVFTGIMVFGMLILSSMSWFSISYFPDFIQIMDTKIIIGMIGVIISSDKYSGLAYIYSSFNIWNLVYKNL